MSSQFSYNKEQWYFDHFDALDDKTAFYIWVPGKNRETEVGLGVSKWKLNGVRDWKLI